MVNVLYLQYNFWLKTTFTSKASDLANLVVKVCLADCSLVRDQKDFQLYLVRLVVFDYSYL